MPIRRFVNTLACFPIVFFFYLSYNDYVTLDESLAGDINVEQQLLLSFCRGSI